MSGPKRSSIEFKLTPQEREIIEQRMAEMGIRNMSAYLRKQALNGYCIRLDLEQISDITSLLRRCSNNLNQYAKRANETGSIYAEDIKDLQALMEEIWNSQRELLKRLAAIR